MSFAMPTGLEALPPDAASILSSYLLGMDLVHLSQSSPKLRELVESSDEGQVWRQRTTCYYGHVRHCNDSRLLKKLLLSERSVLFRGTQVTPVDTKDRWSCARIHSLQLEWDTPVAFDAWFSLLPGDAHTYEGGILLGAQSTAFESSQWPFYHQQFVHVDAQRHLYCSMIQPKRILATLVPHQWYHLALMFDGRFQRVYLDGSLVSQDEGSIHHEAMGLRQLQLGTGCISAGSVGKPTETFGGWYGLHGVIDEFRTWREVLSAEQVAVLATGAIVQDKVPCFSLHAHKARSVNGGAHLIQCSRPCERVCTVYLPMSRVEKSIVGF